MTVSFIQQIENFRQRLIDLSLRNRLIHYRPSTRRSIEICGEKPENICEILITQGRKMGFLPAYDEKKRGKLGTIDDSFKGNQDIKKEWRKQLPGDKVQPEDWDYFLQTSLPENILNKRLFNLAQDARLYWEEHNIDILFLALGFVEWKDRQNDQQLLSPLFLLPVRLVRLGNKREFKLEWRNEDIRENLALRIKLQKQGVNLPQFPEAIYDHQTVTEYLTSVQKILWEVDPSWRVLSHGVVDLFLYHKIWIYEDLDPCRHPCLQHPQTHPILSELFLGNQDSNLSEKDILTENTSDPFLVLDADPSQERVLRYVEKGKNLVVEGPPGTGKSQCIVNIIASALFHGKSVLFVSEKAAALDVVFRRLKEIGIADFCLDLHSHQHNRLDFYRDLGNTLQMHSDETIERTGLEEEYRRTKQQLQDITTALTQPVGKTGRRISEWIGNVLKTMYHFRDRNDLPMLSITYPRCEERSNTDLSFALERLQDLATVMKELPPIPSHPLWGCHPRKLFPQEREELHQCLRRILSAIQELIKQVQVVKEVCSSQVPVTLHIPYQQCEMLEFLLSKDTESFLPIYLKHSDHQKVEKLIDQGKSLIKKIRDRRTQLSQIFNFKGQGNWTNSKIEELIRECQRWSKCWYANICPSYYQFRQELLKYFHPDFLLPARRNWNELIPWFQQWVQLCNDMTELEALGREIQSNVGELWKGEDTDFEVLQRYFQWIRELEDVLSQNLITRATLEVWNYRSCPRGEFSRYLEDLNKALQVFEQSFRPVIEYLNPDEEKIFKKPLNQVPLESILHQCELWMQHQDKLEGWIRFCSICDKVKSSIASPLLSILEQYPLTYQDIIPLFLGSFSASLIRWAIQHNPALHAFQEETIEGTIHKFQELDKQRIQLNRLELKLKLLRQRPLLSPGIKESQIALLYQQINRKRRFMPIRRFLSECNELCIRLKPCFMMSPLSVASYLEPLVWEFDLVVFDEASQLLPEDVLSVLIRGKQVVVMGDSQQLPPTRFFESMEQDRKEELNEEDDDFVESFGQLESFLHLARSRFVSLSLLWHYRSRHHTLIQVSNDFCYQGKLHVCPSPLLYCDYEGVHWYYYPDSYYDRGGTRQNFKEAEEIVKVLIQQLRRYPQHSVGIATFSVAQQGAIVELLEKHLAEHPEDVPLMNQREDEPLFIKNLETVQGDERDVILISVGYGLDRDGKLTAHFGPLNHEGGERRFNVIITRARIRMVIFTNFKSADLAKLVNETSPRGLKMFLTFLRFCEQQIPLSLNEETATVLESENSNTFVEQLKRWLGEEGRCFFSPLLVSEYKKYFDLVVSLPHQSSLRSGGIVVDSGPGEEETNLRERFRLRYEILSKLGWQVYRIWSLPFFFDPAHAMGRVLQLLSGNQEAQRLGDWKEMKVTPNALFCIKKDPSPFREDPIILYRKWDGTWWPDPSWSQIQPMEEIVLPCLIQEILIVEQPIHKKVLYERVIAWYKTYRRRIQEELGLGDNYFSESFLDAVLHHEDAHVWWSVEKEFVYLPEKKIVLRRREQYPELIPYVPPEEWELATNYILRSLLALPQDALAREVFHLIFPRKRPPDSYLQEYNRILNNMMEQNLLKKYPSGRIGFIHSKLGNNGTQ